MASYNRVVLVGNLTRDPQLKFLPSQTAICEFGMAINHKYKTASGEQRDEVCFIECTCFGKAGEVINQYMQKGRPILVEGRLKFDSWEDKQGGGKRSKHTVVVDNFQFLGGRDDAPGGGGGGNGGGDRGQSNTGGYGKSGGGYKMDDDGPASSNARQPASRGPKRPEPKQEQPPEEAPYGDEQHFDEDDIPF